ncbi:GNAT family N-acetyltransferase [Pontibacillus halophilus]|nr:GNAT family N-acetyltransferase [Pontibacillus halophilus]
MEEIVSFIRNGEQFRVRQVHVDDAEALADIRIIIDGETENLDRDSGEGYIDEEGFKAVIERDLHSPYHLFLVAEREGKVVGFSRCEGSPYKRLSHKVEFGVCILKNSWGYGLGKCLLQQSLAWADRNGKKKVTLLVLETNTSAIRLYEQFGFVIEGTLVADKRLSDGNYYNTLVMARFHPRET